MMLATYHFVIARKPKGLTRQSSANPFVFGDLTGLLRRFAPRKVRRGIS